jgi:hypothetical protein
MHNDIKRAYLFIKNTKYVFFTQAKFIYKVIRIFYRNIVILIFYFNSKNVKFSKKNIKIEK